MTKSATRQLALFAAILTLTTAGRANTGQGGGPVTTVTPASHDYRGVAVGESSLAQFTVAANFRDLPIEATIGGADALHFALQNNQAGYWTNLIGSESLTLWNSCSWGQPVQSCPVAVVFRPLSPGVKTATLVLTMEKGRGVITVALRGEGLGAYSGSFGWQSDLNGEWGKNKTDIKVTVVNGAATCFGTETATTISEAENKVYVTTEVGSIRGPGLVAVTFEADSGKPAYRIAVSCPSPHWPASSSNPGYPSRPSQPARWGSSYSEESYLQPVPLPTAKGVLDGFRDMPHPDSDAVNGVSGRMIVSWRLTPSK